MIIKVFNKTTKKLVSINQVASFVPPCSFATPSSAIMHRVDDEHVFELWTDDFTSELFTGGFST